MKRPHASNDVRERALAALADGQSVADVAQFFQNDPSTIRRWRRQHTTTGSGLARPRSGRPPLLRAEEQMVLARQIRAAPDATLAEHCARWLSDHGIVLSLSTMSRRVRDLGFTLEKKTLIAREQDAAARTAWRELMATCDPANLIFLDETSTPTTLTPLRARAPRGERAVGRVPRGRWHTTTLLASLTLSGFGPGLQFAGPVDRSAFDTFVEQILVPTLTPGKTVVLDNLSVHKSARARQLIEAAGCHLLFLPTYSPDFNPIEQAIAKLKHLLRKAAARTTEAVMTATQTNWNQITASDAHGFFRDAGYNL